MRLPRSYLPRNDVIHYKPSLRAECNGAWQSVTFETLTKIATIIQKIAAVVFSITLQTRPRNGDTILYSVITLSPLSQLRGTPTS